MTHTKPQSTTHTTQLTAFGREILAIMVTEMLAAHQHNLAHFEAKRRAYSAGVFDQRVIKKIEAGEHQRTYHAGQIAALMTALQVDALQVDDRRPQVIYDVIEAVAAQIGTESLDRESQRLKTQQALMNLCVNMDFPITELEALIHRLLPDRDPISLN